MPHGRGVMSVSFDKCIVRNIQTLWTTGKGRWRMKEPSVVAQLKFWMLFPVSTCFQLGTFAFAKYRYLL